MVASDSKDGPVVLTGGFHVLNLLMKTIGTLLKAEPISAIAELEAWTLTAVDHRQLRHIWPVHQAPSTTTNATTSSPFARQHVEASD